MKKSEIIAIIIGGAFISTLIAGSLMDDSSPPQSTMSTPTTTANQHVDTAATPPPVPSSDTAPSDEQRYGQLARDAHARGIPGDVTRLGTLAIASCTVTNGAFTPDDARAILRNSNDQRDWWLLQSWTRAQKRTFADLTIADGLCDPETNTGLDLGS